MGFNCAAKRGQGNIDVEEINNASHALETNATPQNGDQVVSATRCLTTPYMQCLSSFLSLFAIRTRRVDQDENACLLCCMQQSQEKAIAAHGGARHGKGGTSYRENKRQEPHVVVQLGVEDVSVDRVGSKLREILVEGRQEDRMGRFVCQR